MSMFFKYILKKRHVFKKRVTFEFHSHSKNKIFAFSKPLSFQCKPKNLMNEIIQSILDIHLFCNLFYIKFKSKNSQIKVMLCVIFILSIHRI